MASRDEREPIEDFVSELEVGAFDHVIDDDGDVWGYYGIFTQPSFAFINDDGTVQVFLGAMGLEGLTKVVEEALQP